MILAESVEHEEEEEESYGALGEAPDAPETVEILDKWCADLTRQARDGEIDPVIGREAELRQVIDILLRRRQNNPILVGEAGVGKTAVAEALACKIAQGRCRRCCRAPGCCLWISGACRLGQACGANSNRA